MNTDILDTEISATRLDLSNTTENEALSTALADHLAGLLTLKRDHIKSVISGDLKNEINKREFDNDEAIRKIAYSIARETINDMREFDEDSTRPEDLKVGDSVKIEGYWVERGYADVLDINPHGKQWILKVQFTGDETASLIHLENQKMLKLT